MSEKIRQIYRLAKLKAPDGKGIHTKKFHEVAVAIKKSNPSYSMSRCYAIAMGTLGRNKSVKKVHQR
jgi:hypothetical protein